MTIFRGITGSGDWTFGQGVNSYFTRDLAIAADIKTSVLFFLNDFFAGMDVGIDWWNLLGGKNPTARNNILLQTRQTIIQREGVVRINSVDTDFDAATRGLTVRFNVDTIYTRNVGGSVQIS